jgi:protease I
MNLTGKKIAVLIESDYYEPEIAYYQHRFAEEDAELHLMSRLWGQPSLTFYGHEYKAPLRCEESFEAISDEQLHEFDAVIVPSGMVSDRLRYTEDVAKLPPATEFLQRAFADVRGRTVTGHNNLFGDIRNMGAVYADQDVVVDGDLVTGRSGPLCHLFARKIIDTLNEKN